MNQIVHCFFHASRGVYNPRNKQTPIQRGPEESEQWLKWAQGHGQLCGFDFFTLHLNVTLYSSAPWLCAVSEGRRWMGTRRGPVCLASHWHSPRLRPRLLTAICCWDGLLWLGRTKSLSVADTLWMQLPSGPTRLRQPCSHSSQRTAASEIKRKKKIEKEKVFSCFALIN